MFLPFILCIVIACNLDTNKKYIKNSKPVKEIIDTAQNLLKDRFRTPNGFHRKTLDSNSYGSFLRNLKLKAHNQKARYFNDNIKENNGIYCAVIDQTISKRDLQQCADAVMRLRGEYLFEQKRYDEIHFNFLSDNKPRYFKGYGDKTTTYKNFLSYMNYVFAFANTRSLFNELKPVNPLEMEIGDVFIQTGNPFGHAITVMDMAENSEGAKIFLLSQSYMPAQETQILINPKEKEISPWFSLKQAGDLITPEWSFKFGDLRRFVTE